MIVCDSHIISGPQSVQNLCGTTSTTVYLQHGFVLLDNSTLEIRPVLTEAFVSANNGAPHIVRRVPGLRAAAGNYRAIKSASHKSR
jgi:hypothetical protein